MGIKNLKLFLKRYTPECFESIPLSYFSNKHIAIDSSNFIFMKWASAHREVVEKMDNLEINPDKREITRIWLIKIQSFIDLFLSFRIIPVFVFDGMYPIEKKETQDKRRQDKQKIKDKLEKLKNEFGSLDISQRTPTHTEQLRKLLYQNIIVSNEEIELFKTLVYSLGIPYSQSLGEAEKLCSSLCIEDKVHAVFSTDMDNLAHGCPLLLYELNRMYDYKREEFTECFKAIRLSKILESSQLSFDSFLDLCICLGCDYNNYKNIPTIGPVRAYQLIKRYTNFENFPNDKYDLSTLSYKKCREIFSKENSNSLSETLFLNIRPITDEAKNILTNYFSDSWINRFQKQFHSL